MLAYLLTVLIFDLQNLRKSGRPDFPEFQPVTILVFKIIFSMSCLCKPRRNLFYRCEPSAKSGVRVHTPRQRLINLLRPSSSPGLSASNKSAGYDGKLGTCRHLCSNTRGESSLGQNGGNVLIYFWFQNVGKYVLVKQWWTVFDQCWIVLNAGVFKRCQHYPTLSNTNL